MENIQLNKIPILVINLEKRKDRLLKMKTRLNGLEFKRIQAVDKCTLNLEGVDFSNELSFPELACIASHLKALKIFLESENEACCILEDDVILGQDFFKILKSNFKFPSNAYIIKLETYDQRIWHSKNSYRVNDSRLDKLHSHHYGSAAYLTSRKGAKSLIEELEKYDTAVDLVFFENMLRGNKYGHALQLNPACCIQENLKDPTIDSDIYKERHEVWLKNKTQLDRYSVVPKNKFLRESKRIFNQICGTSIIILEFLKANCFTRKYGKIKFKS